jgi:hypothetical protein
MNDIHGSPVVAGDFIRFPTPLSYGHHIVQFKYAKVLGIVKSTKLGHREALKIRSVSFTKEFDLPKGGTPVWSLSGKSARLENLYYIERVEEKDLPLAVAELFKQSDSSKSEESQSE